MNFSTVEDVYLFVIISYLKRPIGSYRITNINKYFSCDKFPATTAKIGVFAAEYDGASNTTRLVRFSY